MIDMKTALKEPHTLQMHLLRPVDDPHRDSAPPAFVRFEIAGNELRVLLESGLIAAGVHTGYQYLTDQRDVLDPRIVP